MPGCYRVFKWADGELQGRTYALPPASFEVDGDPSEISALGYGFRGTEPAGRAPNSNGTLTPMEWRHHMGRTDRVNVVEAQGESTASARRTQLTEAWRFQLSGGVRLAAPVVSHGRLLIGTQDEDRPKEAKSSA